MNTAVGAGEVSFEYKGILDGKYTEGIIAALNRDEASFKLKTQRVIITSLAVSYTHLTLPTILLV